MSIRMLYVLADLRKDPLRAIRQLVFYIPIITLGLFIALVGVLPAINQVLFLQRAPYAGCISSADKGSLGFAKAYALTGKIDKMNSLAIDQMIACDAYYYTDSDDIDFNVGPFAESMLVKGDGPAKLTYGDMIVSEQVFNTLGVKLNDEVLLESADDQKEQFIHCRLKGVIECKYATDSVFVGGDGVMLVKLPQDTINQVFADGNRVKFVNDAQEQFAGIKKSDEVTAALNESSSATAIGTIVVLAAALILLVLSRETAHALQKRKRSLAVLNVLGVPIEKLVGCIMLEEMAIMLVADLISVSLARMILQSSLFNLVFPLWLVVSLVGGLLVVEYILVSFFSLRTSARINERDLSEQLSGAEV